MLRDVDLQIEWTRLQGEGRWPIAEPLRPMTDHAVRSKEGSTRGDGRGRVGGRILREARRQRDRWRRDVRRDRVAEAERDDDERAQEARALREAAPIVSAAPPDQREQTEEDGSHREHDRDLFQTLPRDRKRHFG